MRVFERLCKYVITRHLERERAASSYTAEQDTWDLHLGTKLQLSCHAAFTQPHSTDEMKTSESLNSVIMNAMPALITAPADAASGPSGQGRRVSVLRVLRHVQACTARLNAALESCPI